jgi:DNA polymerase III psi subunit
MSDQLTNNPEALRLFFTEDIFLVDAPQTTPEGFTVANETSIEAAVPVQAVNIPAITASETFTTPETASDHVPAVVGIPAPAAQPFSYVGANERNILILVNDDRHPVSTLQGRELLGNILKAINLNRNDCALVNYASCNSANFAQFNGFFKPQYVFAFGVSPEQLGIPGATYNSIVTQGESKLIFSSNLDALSGDAATKKLLWASLKQINI